MKMLSNLLSNTPPQRESRALGNHFSKTYMSLRTGLFMLAFTMPFVLNLYGKFRHGLDFQPSMSAYFWAATQDQCATFPMRTIFVGYLFAIGVGLDVHQITDADHRDQERMSLLKNYVEQLIIFHLATRVPKDREVATDEVCVPQSDLSFVYWSPFNREPVALRRSSS